MPELEPMVALVVLELLHTPPVVADVSVPLAPIHTVVGPVIKLGSAYTVTVADAAQPPGML